MKSAGEQSAGQASRQGFSAQFSQRLNSSFNWASERKAVWVFSSNYEAAFLTLAHGDAEFERLDRAAQAAFRAVLG